MSYALARPFRLGIEPYSRLTGVHPELVRRLVRLGLLEVTQDAEGNLWFDASQVGTMARIQRLRSGFGLNYAALGLVLDLLDRIADLERTQTRVSTQFGVTTWT
jgi:DNA-binding transcriptional MerR regulator